jgi:putative transcriptional regulator
MLPKYRSKLLAAVHETAADLRRGGGMNPKTMRKFDALCLTPIQKMTPKKIRALRTNEKPKHPPASNGAQPVP